MVNFRRKGNILASGNYVELPGVNRDVARILLDLANNSEGSHYWIRKKRLDDVLAEKGLELKVLQEDPFSLDFGGKSANSVVYRYNVQDDLVRVTPTPFATGLEVQGYFAIRNPEYVGK